MAEISLEKWLTERLLDEVKGQCSALSCVHKVGGSDSEVYGIKLGDNQWDVKKLAEIFVHKAKIRVQEEPGSHLFHVLAFYNEELPSDRYPFRINSSAELGGGATEEPTDRGKLAQSMRHSEAGFQFMFRQSAVLFEQTLQMNRDLMKYNREITAENADAFKVVKEVLMASATNQHELRMKEMQFIRSMKQEEQFTKMLPALANTITGSEVFPIEKQDTSIVEMLLSGMNEQQLKVFVSMLPSDEAKAIVTARATEFFRSRRVAQETAEKAAQNSPELGEAAE